jgi:subtilisin family serine protease
MGGAQRKKKSIRTFLDTRAEASRPFATYFLFLLLGMAALDLYGQQSNHKTIHVKFKEKENQTVIAFFSNSAANPSARKSGLSGISGVDKVSEKHKAYSLKRIFPEAGKFEEAHKAYGLHLWYEIELENDAPMKAAVEDYRATGSFDNVEESRPYSYVRGVEEMSEFTPVPTLTAGSNDPEFNKQWHFKNQGQTGGTSGADINLIKAWQKETGSPNVIVAVIDGGINTKHPDLQDALWVNTREIPGNGKDDDQNGYIDDINGYGFGDKTSAIHADDHATHVAGTIGAITNNGVGVSGIAGGNGSESGVRLMSCAGFGRFGIGGFEQAMVYAADNGAVISQNSWGGGSRAIEAAIDYFINRAGYDNSAPNFNKNIQTGPMAGGIVIFAAGNDNTSNTYYGYPGSYEKVIAVGATDHRDVKSVFSNYGPWVDIFAPGTNVFSTTVSGYQNFSGTSMACPHVSGVAALVVSNLQRSGLKPNEVWNRLRLSARSINAINPDFVGQLGWGRLDAFVALKEPDLIPPGAIMDLRAEQIKSTSLWLNWTASGENGNDGQAAAYEVRFSTSPITDANFGSATLLPNLPTPPMSGEPVSFPVTNLAPATTYYFGIKCVDLFNNISTLSNVLTIRTLRPPIPELITAQLLDNLYTGGVSNRKILVKNIGEEDLMVRTGVPQLQSVPVLPPLGTTGRLFAINTSNNTIEELNNKTGEVVRTIAMPEPSTKTIEGLAFDGHHLYYGRSQKIYKMNAVTGLVVNTIFLSDAININGLAWSGRYLYVSRYNNGSYVTHEVDVDSEKIIRTLSHYSELAFLGSNNTLLFAGIGRIDEVDISSGNVVRVIPATNPRSMAFSNHENLLFVQNDNSTSVHAVRPTDGSIVYTFPYPATTALAGDEHKLGWFQSSGDVISIGTGKIGEIPVKFISAGLNASTLTGSVNVIPMNTNTNRLPVSLALTVLAGTDIETAREINFGTRYVGFPIDTTVVIENRGFAPLIISQIQSDNNRVSSSLSSATLAPGQRINMQVSMQSGSLGHISASIRFTSNDPDESILSVPVTAVILEAPVVNVTPDSLLIILKEGASTTRTISVANTGGSTFSWSASLSGTDPTGSSQSATDQSRAIEQVSMGQKNISGEIELRSSSPETLTGLVYDPVGELIYAKSLAGNNFYEYNPATDKWSQVGLASGSFYGQGTCLNRKLYFGGTQLNVYSILSKSWSAVAFPVAGTAQSVTNDDKYVYVGIERVLYRFDPNTGSWLELAGALGPLFMTGFGALSYHSGTIYANGTQYISGDGNTLFLKYFPETNSWFRSESIAGVASLGGAIDASSSRYFVVGAPVALPENRIQMSMLDIRNGEWTKWAMPFAVGFSSGLVFVGKAGASGIYFIQGADGTKFGYYETPSASNWFSVTPSSGSIGNGETQSLTVKVNAQSLFGGIYRGNIKIASSRPSIQKNVPLELRVAGSADLVMDNTNSDVGNVILGYQGGTSILVRNKGSAELVVSNILISSSDFDISKTSFRLPVGEVTSISLYFKPTSVGKQVGLFTFLSNDSSQSNLNFTVTGNGVYPANLKVPGDTIKVALLTGQTANRKFIIENIGQGPTPYLSVWGVENWIAIDSAGWAMNINAASQREFEARISGKGLLQGKYTGSIRVEDYRDPRHPSYSIPVLLAVTSAPDFTSNMDSLDFGNQFLTSSYDSSFQIKNTGVLPLLISSWSLDNTVFKTQASTPVTLQPGETFDLNIRFSPTTVGLQKAKLTFTTNDPDESSVVFNVIGAGVNPPIAKSSRTELFFTAYPKESKSEEISLSNAGGSLLKWRADKELDPQPIGGVFSQKADVPLPFQYSGVSLTALTADPASGVLYGQYPWYQELYAYSPRTNTWTKVGRAPARSHRAIGGAVILDRKMYCSYADDQSKIYVYDFVLKDWSTRPNSLNFAATTVTTDGKLLYLVGEGKFASYNPRNGEWKNLLMPSLPLDGAGGLSHLDGVIYAHSSSNNRFSKYVIATGSWENLVPIPGKTATGSTVDITRKRYYAYGENYLYEYDISNNVWTSLFVQFFKFGSNGGIAHLSSVGYEGVYFRQAETQKGFGRYQPEDTFTWLRTSQLIGIVDPMDNQVIGVNCNTANLGPGLYRGKIKVTTNDPKSLAFDIPVTLNVKDPAPKINNTPLISDSVSRSMPTTKYLMIKNEGRDRLDWRITNALPNWLSANKLTGSVVEQRTDSIVIVFDPAKFPIARQADHTIEINSNDPRLLNAKTRALFTLKNRKPIVTKPIANQSLGAGPVEIPLLENFSDPDGDILSFSASSSANTVVTAMIQGSRLVLNPLKTGVAKVAITASDLLSSSTTMEFEVNTIVTGIEPTRARGIFLVSPNPFESSIKISFNGPAIGTSIITIIDSTGRIVFQSNPIDTSRETHLEIDSIRLAAGMYFCTWTVDGKYENSTKLIKR